MADDLQCQRVVELVTDYLEGAMPPEDRVRFELHLDTCPHCAVYLQQMRTTIDALGRAHAADVAPEVQQDLLEAFRGWRSRQGG